MTKGFVLLLFGLVLGVQPIGIGLGLSEYWLVLLGCINILCVVAISLSNGIDTRTQSESMKYSREAISHFVKHYGFFISYLVLLLSIFQAVTHLGSGSSLFWSIPLFIVLFLINGKSISTGGLYFGNLLLFPKDFLFFFAVLVGSTLFTMLGTVPRFYKIFLAFLVTLVVFVLFVNVLKFMRVKAFWKLWSAKFLVIGTVISLLFSLYGFSLNLGSSYIMNGTMNTRQFVWLELNDMRQLGSKNIIASWNNTTQPTYLRVANSGENNSGDIENRSGSNTTGSEYSGIFRILTGRSDIVSGDIISVLSGDSLTGAEIIDSSGGQTTITGVSINKEIEALPVGDLSYRVLVPYLLKKYNVAFSQEKNISFDTIAFSEAEYPSFKTAYYLRMLGRNVKVDSKMKCDTYIVMKGILENWTINQGAGESVFDAYRKAGIQNNGIENCIKGSFITKTNLLP